MIVYLNEQCQEDEDKLSESSISVNKSAKYFK